MKDEDLTVYEAPQAHKAIDKTKLKPRDLVKIAENELYLRKIRHNDENTIRLRYRDSDLENLIKQNKGKS